MNDISLETAFATWPCIFERSAPLPCRIAIRSLEPMLTV